MKHTGLIIVLVIAFTISSSVVCCGIGSSVVFGSGRVVEEIFEVSDFSGVKLATFGDLVIEMGEEESLRVEAEKNLIKYFEVTVESGMLKIDNRGFVNLYPTKPVKFYLTAKELDTIVLSGSGNVQAPDLEGERVSITISGSGDLDVEGSQAGRQEITVSGSGDLRIDELEADELEVRVSGSGDVRVSGGEADEQRVSIYGAGDYRARDLASEEANVVITGSGSVDIRVSERLQAKITGSGDIGYVGSPDISRTITGSGDLAQVGD
jgi:hypothetical protein